MPIKRPSSQAGFTLIEVMVALLILVIVSSFVTIATQTGISTQARSEKKGIAAMLISNKLHETELELEGKSFTEIKEEDKGDFQAPYTDYRWEREIKEIELPNLATGTGSGGGGEEQDSGDEGKDSTTELIYRLLTKHLNDSIREVRVRIFWPSGSSEENFEVTTYWVDFNREFSINE